MRTDEYERMYSAEDKHWWYTGLRAILEHDVRTATQKTQAARVLDAGCGTGGDLHMLSRISAAYGFDISNEALAFTLKRGQRNITRASIMHIPYKSETFHVVLTTDVLYHNWVPDDLAALREIHRVLKPGGTIILHTAAFEFLRGSHDKVVLTRHRYTAPELKKQLEATGFHITHMTYRNSLLAPVVLAHRLYSTIFNSRSEQSDVKLPSPKINRFLTWVLQLENKMVRKYRLPFGTSLYCTATKPMLKPGVDRVCPA